MIASEFTESRELKPANIQKDRSKSEADTQMAMFLPNPTKSNPTSIPIQTIHGVKGETHDLTVFVCPPPEGKVKCPSDQWWPLATESQEERRIAYVAMTRSQKDLIVMVSRKTAENLKVKRPEFFGCFECKTVEQYILESQ